MELMAAMSALSTALGIAKTAVEARDEAKINVALAEINTKQLALSMAALHLAESLSACQAAKSELERENRDLVGKLEERQRYVLHELSPGRIAYRFSPLPDSLEPEHYLCQICYDKGVKSVLRLYDRDEWTARHYACAAVEKGSHDLYF